MNTHNYPTWLAPLEIAKELKEIGFDSDDALLVKLYNIKSNEIIDPSWERCYRISYLRDYWDNPKDYVPLHTYEQVFAWFRAKGYKITFKDINIGTQCAFYHLDIKEGHTFSYFAKKYEKAREGLVMKLIEVHKEFGNNIKRFD